MPDAPWTSGSMTTAASSPAWASMAAHALSAQPGIGVARRAHDGEAQRLEDGAEHTAVAEGERADGVAVVGVAEREEGRAARRRPG